METTFYEDSRYRGGAEVVGRGAAMKRPATLDLNCRSSKKPRGNTLLTSPDLRMLKLESPELEKLIIQQHGILQQPNQCMYPKAADDNRDPYARGDFPDALGGLQHQQPQSNYNLYQQPQGNLQQEDVTHLVNGCNALPPTSMPSSTLVDAYGYHHQQPLSVINGNCPSVVVSSSNNNNNSCYAPVSNGFYAMEPLVSIKEEPQTVPCASPHDPPRSPIDMEDQERLKLERKRLRNRIAASKCRRRKLERIARLEDKVAHLKSENAELANHVTRLKEHVCQLKQQVMEHVRSGCEILVAPSYPPYPEDL